MNPPACAVIVARGGSKRLTHKNLRRVAGVPILTRAINACREAGRLVSPIAVTTDDLEIAQIARASDAIVVSRPTELSTDTARIDEAVAHALGQLYRDGNAPDYCCIVQPNIPLWEPGTVERAIRRMLRGDCTAVITGHHIHERPEWAMQLEDGYLHPYILSSKPRAVNSQELDQTVYHIDGQLLVVESKRLMSGCWPRKYLGACGPRIALQKHEPHFGADVDTYYDLVAADAIGRELEKEGRL